MSSNKVQVTEEIGIYLDEVRAACPAIDEVWLIGARAGDTPRRDAPWELLLFADAGTLESLRGADDMRRDDVVLLVVTDGDAFASAWGEDRRGRLDEWRWRREDPHTASYDDPHGGRRAAVRVR